MAHTKDNPDNADTQAEAAFVAAESLFLSRSRRASSCPRAWCRPCRLQQCFLPRFQIATAPVTLATLFSLCCLAALLVTLASLAAALATAPVALAARFSPASPAAALPGRLACPIASAHAATEQAPLVAALADVSRPYASRLPRLPTHFAAALVVLAAAFVSLSAALAAALVAQPPHESR